MAEKRMVSTLRECEGRLVPVGDKVIVPANEFVTITQSLGGNYTIVFRGNMVRIDGKDADALGFEKLSLNFTEPTDKKISRDQVEQALATVYDPEIPVNLMSLGLIYNIEIDDAEQSVLIDMTLTAPGCGMGPVLVSDVETRVGMVPFVKKVQVHLVFDPPWTRDRMSEEAQLETGMFF